jgi:2-octaprenyl-6-methoxyphenol hydroxylase
MVPPGRSRIAIVGSGPAGLAAAVLAADLLPEASITLFGGAGPPPEPSTPEVSSSAPDVRAIALSIGSTRLLKRLAAWDESQARAITEVQASLSGPDASTFFSQMLPRRFSSRATADAAATGTATPVVQIRAADLGLPELGSVVPAAALLVGLTAAWQCRLDQSRARLRWHRSSALARNTADGVELDVAAGEHYDFALLAGGGVKRREASASWTRTYPQRAWTGTVTLDSTLGGVAIERFTRAGPLALLPLRDSPGGSPQASLVWCVPTLDDPLPRLGEPARLLLLNQLLPPGSPQITGLGLLQPFGLRLVACRQIADGRCISLGNAAQTLHPVAGQGLNLALRDVFSTIESLRDASSFPSAVKRVLQRREPDRWATIASTDILARLFATEGPIAGLLGSFALSSVQSSGLAKAELARKLMFGIRW